MKISASKLIANRVNAQKSTGPRSVEGKLASSINARRHGLAASPPNKLATDPRLESLAKEARAIGFSLEEARQLALTLLAARSVIDAKHAAYDPEPESEPAPRKDPVATFGQEMVDEALELGITMDELWDYANPPEPTLAELGLHEPDPVAERIDEHRRLMRYEQRAVNQIRKAASIKKKQNEPNRAVGRHFSLTHDKGFYRNFECRCMMMRSELSKTLFVKTNGRKY